MARLSKQTTTLPQPTKTIAPCQQDTQPLETHPAIDNRIYLNRVIYDQRKGEERKLSITLPQLLHPNVETFPARPVSPEVQAILATTFGYEMEVFEPILRAGVPMFVFNREDESKAGSVSRGAQGFAGLTLVSPPKNNMYGVFHPKLWLIKFKSFLRVMVCTSNNHAYDWAVWQNAYWLHDCPLKTHLPKEQQPPPEEQPPKDKASKEPPVEAPFDYEQDFLETLKWVLSEIQPAGLDVLKEMAITLEDYSFWAVRAILIPSLSGRFKGDSLDKVGLGKVRKVMRQLQVRLESPTLTASCTSLGKLDEKFARDVYSSFCPFERLFSSEKVKVVYPTDSYIQE
jgi:tyrosyl-DNA phosphodiesterase 1